MRFLLVDAVNNQIVNDFGNDTTLSLADLPEFNIVAEPEMDGVQNVVFELNGTEFSTDNTAPYSLGEDNGGDFQPLSLETGEYTLVATPFILSTNGDTVAGTPFTVSFTVVDSEQVKTEFNIEAEAEAEAQAQANVDDGIAAGAVALGAGAAASGNNAIAETITSGSISLDSRIPAPRISSSGGDTSAASLSNANLLDANTDPSNELPIANVDSSADVSVISAEAEVDTESEVEVEITNGAASATGGSAGSAAAVGTNIVLFEDGSSKPVAGDTQTATDAATSTSTSVSPVLLLFAAEEPETNSSTTIASADAPLDISTNTSSDLSSQSVTAAKVEKDKFKKDRFKKYKSKLLPVLVLDTEAEVEAQAQAEAEAEAGAMSNTMAAAVVTVPGAAAAAVSGGTAVAVAGDFATAKAESSVATSTSTSAVTQAEFDFQTQDQIESELLNDGQTDWGTQSSESLAQREGVVAKSSADAGRYKDNRDKDNRGRDKDKKGKNKDKKGLVTIAGKGSFEAEAKVEAQAEVEAEASNNSAAVASIANGGGGAAGFAATTQVSTSSTASTSTQFDVGEQTRKNDVVDRDRNRFSGAVDFADQSIAEVITEAEAEASINEDRLPITSASANNFTRGDATAESKTTLEGSTSSIPGGETKGDIFVNGTPSKDESKGKNKNKGKNKYKDLVSEDGNVVGSPDNLEIEIETEVKAEAETQISFNAAAAGASAIAVQAKNGFLPAPAEGATATSSSTSVFDNGENRFDDKDVPGPATAGERGDLSVLIFEIETDAEAEAEVGFNAGAAAASASVAGKQGLVPDTEILTTPFAAAAASGAAPIVELEIFAPEGTEAGNVVARARAFDPDGNPVAVAVAVAGVPTESGIDNEQEAEAQGLGEAIVEVSIFTDPANAANLLWLADEETSYEAKAEAEAEAGYGVAAAAGSSGSAGLFSDASAKSSTSTLPLFLANSGETILGTSDRDRLSGTNRGDFIAGLGESDRLTGNGGNDLFVFDSITDETDTITDFEVGSDQIVLTNLLARLNITSSDPLADGFIELREEYGSTTVSIDSDGFGDAEAQALVLVQNVMVDNLNSLSNFAV